MFSKSRLRGKTEELKRPCLDGSSSILYRCRYVHTLLRKIDVFDLWLELRMGTRTDAGGRLGSVLRHLAKAFWMCALENTSQAGQNLDLAGE